jgi:hypothetical protein
MGDFTFSIESDVEEALERLQEAISELDGMTFEVEVDASEPELAPRRKRGRRREETADTVTVNWVRSTLGPFEPWGHATLSVDGDTAVGLESNSTAAAAAGLAEDLGGALPLGGPAIPTPHFVAGHIEPGHRVPIHHATIRVTPEEAAEMRAFVKGAETHPQVYDALHQNCAEWVEEVLQAASIGAPNDITPGGLVEYLKKKNPQR